jgi:RHS repeat-associated protein
MLTGVTSGATNYGTLSYYPNLLVSQVAHGNGVVETQGNDPNGIRRPSSLAATGPYASWSSGSYSYDGAGNIKAIGPSAFTYDPVSRLVSASLYDGPTGGGTLKQQSYTFDAFGNFQAIAGTSGRSTPTSSQTNRLSGAVSYDAAGNLTAWNGATYVYDAFNQMVQMASGAESWAYLYTADDERVWSYDVARNASHWTLRDLGGKVLRDYQSSQGHWSVGTDYVYRDGLLLAAETQTGQRHFHLDHLGTPRLITRGSGDRVAYHVYYPFGEELTAINQDTERMKFTGHERDLASPAGAGDDLDYMHARHESPVTGRFLSVDPALESAEPKSPQTWNRYNYVAGNPLKYVDPTGEILYFFGSAANLEKLKKEVNNSLYGFDLTIDKNGKAALVPNNEAGPPTPEQQAFSRTLADAISRPQSISLSVVSGDTDVVFGQFISGKLDIQDIGAVGSGRGVNSAALIAHEVAEQTAKQTLGIPSTGDGHAQAHVYGVEAQQAASGYHLISRAGELDENLSGTLVGVHQRGSERVTVTFQFVNGNLVKFTRN